MGIIIFVCEVPENTDVGINHIVAHAIPNTNNTEYGDSWSDPTIEIYSDTKLNLSMLDFVELEYPFRITGDLLDVDNKPLSEKNISIYWNNSYIGVTNTDTNGSFILNYTCNTPSNFIIHAVFEGDEYLNSSNDSKIITVKDMGTSLEITVIPTSIKKSDELRIKGVLYTGSNDTIQDSLIYIYYNDKQILSTTTSPQGKFEVTISLPEDSPIGENIVKAHYRGVDIYAEAYAEQTINVQDSAEELTIYIILGIICAIIIPLLILLKKKFKKRRKKGGSALEKIATQTIHQLETETDYRKTVIKCYKQMCKWMKSIGIPKASYQTPREFAITAENLLEIPPESLYALTQIFEKAKYSTHEININDRDKAISSLNEIMSAQVNISAENVERTEKTDKRGL